MKADIAGVVSLLTQQPRALQKHPRLLVTIRKRILGQSPAVGTRGAMQIPQTSHAQGHHTPHTVTLSSSTFFRASCIFGRIDIK